MAIRKITEEQVKRYKVVIKRKAQKLSLFLQMQKTLNIRINIQNNKSYEINKTNEIVNNAICLPSGYSMSSSKIKKIVKILKEFK
jgi:dTDP-4-amino-4,6-dideoxygalactose transaminase